MLRFALFELLLIASPFAVWLIWRALSDMRAKEADSPPERAMPVGALFIAGAVLAVAGAFIAALVTSGDEDSWREEARDRPPLERQERPFP